MDRIRIGHNLRLTYYPFLTIDLNSCGTIQSPCCSTSNRPNKGKNILSLRYNSNRFIKAFWVKIVAVQFKHCFLGQRRVKTSSHCGTIQNSPSSMHSFLGKNILSLRYNSNLSTRNIRPEVKTSSHCGTIQNSPSSMHSFLGKNILSLRYNSNTGVLKNILSLRYNSNKHLEFHQSFLGKNILPLRYNSNRNFNLW